MLIQGGKSNDGNVTGLDLSTVRASNGTHLYAFDEQNRKQDYLVEATQRVDGVLLGSGNYANPTPVINSPYEHNETANRNTVGAHDDIYIRTITLVEAQTEDAPVGTRYTVTDLDNARYDVVDGSDVGGFYVGTMASGRKLVLILPQGVVRPTLKWFNVLQNGLDQTATTQAAVNWLFDNGYHECTQPLGDTYQGQVFYPCGDTTANAGFSVYGCGIGASRILGTASGAVTLKRRNGTGDALRFKMHDLSVVSSGGQWDFGIYAPDGTAYTELNKLHVVGFKKNIKLPANTYICRFTNLFLSGSPEIGFDMSGGSGTTNTFDNIFVFGATVSAYSLTGAYSCVGTLAADSCSGVNLYDFSFFSGTVASLGSELNTVTNIVSASNSNLSIGFLSSFRNTMSNSPALGRIILGVGSVVNIDRYKVEQQSQFDATFAPIDLFDGKVRIGQSSLVNVSFTGEPDGSTDTEGFIVSTEDSTGIAVSNDGTRRGYIGLDRGRTRFAEADPRVRGTLAVPKAIFLDAVGQPRFDSDGNDYRFGRPARIGDWFLESKPLDNRVAAYVITGTGSDLNACTYKRVIFEQKGTTAQRPTLSLRAGEQYFDTDLDRWIYWSSTNSRWQYMDGTPA